MLGFVLIPAKIFYLIVGNNKRLVSALKAVQTTRLIFADV
jgi:hypothetical protein